MKKLTLSLLLLIFVSCASNVRHASIPTFAYAETDVIMLEWQAGTGNGGGAVIDYNIYRDGDLFSTIIKNKEELCRSFF